MQETHWGEATVTQLMRDKPLCVHQGSIGEMLRERPKKRFSLKMTLRTFTYHCVRSGIQRQEDPCELEASLIYLASSRIARII